jgi:hypothetical protein
MEQYWKTRPTNSRTMPTNSLDNIVPNYESILSEFDRHRLALLTNQDEEEEGWQPEMRQYLKELPANVKKDTDIVKW